MERTSLTRRDTLRVGATAALAGLAGCSGSIGGSATVYGRWTPAQEGSGANQSGESIRAMEPADLDEGRHTLGDRYDLMAAFLEPPVPTMEFGELDAVYYNGGWTTSLYGVEAEFEQSAMVSAYQNELDAETVNSTYSGYELYRVDATLTSYLVGVADGRIAISSNGDRDRAAIESLIDAREDGTRRTNNDGPLSSLESAVGQESSTEISVGDDVGVQVGETTPTAVAMGFSVTDTEEDLVSLTSGFILPDTVTEPEAAVEARLSADASVGVLNYSEAEISTDSGVVVATEERPVADGLAF
ncbi:hypothetical protein [Halolamina salifodinae]|uniref:Uncharacterized protein n=1 Tax=Halolamina salifodinae TaxID=1202767 RepID=A0A8T4H272_9EURY|nr:hypothetical protein [Halolamina salifodinae]MBP1987378.1 hypothetical protein [Halolamina salifodinae]